MEPSTDLLTAEGYDMTIGTSVLGESCYVVVQVIVLKSHLYDSGPYYFTTLLLPALLAVSGDGTQKARIVTASSFGSELASKVDYYAFKENGEKRRALGPVSGLNAQSKWVLTIVELISKCLPWTNDGVLAEYHVHCRVLSSLRR